MCIQRTRYRCEHRHLRQLPCNHSKKAKQLRNCFGFMPSTEVPCHSRYDWDLDELCPKCRMRQEEREARELDSRDYASSTLSPLPLYIPQQSRVYYQPSHSARAARDSRPDSYYDLQLNADVANLPGYYDVSTPARLAVPSQPQPARLLPEQTPAQDSRSRMPTPPVSTLSRQHRRPPHMLLSVASPYPSRYQLGDGEVSPVSSGEPDSHLVSPLGSVEDMSRMPRQQGSQTP